MAKTLLCPHCQQEKPVQHVRFCTKNPERVQGPGRPTKAAELAAAGQPEEVHGDMAAVQIEVDLADMKPVEAMPNLEKEKASDVTATVREVTPEQARAAAKAMTRIMVNGLTGIGDMAISSRLPRYLPPGCPEPPKPVSEKEKEDLAEQCWPAVVYYMPMLADKPWVPAAMAIGAVYAPRFMAAKAVIDWCEENKGRPQQPVQPETRAVPTTSPMVLAVNPNASLARDDDQLLALGDLAVKSHTRGAQ